MKVSILQEHLLKALTRTGRIISPKSQLPITQSVLLQTQEGRVKIAATNLETTEVIWVGAKVTQEGGICVPARLFTEFVATLPQDTVELTIAEGSLTVKCGKFTATLPGTPTAEFPPVPAVTTEQSITLARDTALTAVAQVLFAAATDEGRPLLTGIRFHASDGEMVIVATDGYRLAMKKVAITSDDAFDLVVPARALAEVVKGSTEEKESGDITMVRFAENQLLFRMGDTELYTRLIDGEYPNVEKIIPKSFLTRLVVDKQELARAVKSAALFARDSANLIRFHIEGQEIVVSANTPQVGENRVDVEAAVEGDGGDIAFNSRFLMEFLNNYGPDALVFEMTGSLNPGVFHPKDDESALHIIMPVRVSA